MTPPEPHPCRLHAAWLSLSLALLLSIIPRAQAAQAYVWCSLSDPAAERLYLSDVDTLASSTHIQVWLYGGRFIQTVDARFNIHAGDGDHACRVFPTRAKAILARADIVASNTRQNIHIVPVGEF